MNKILFLKTNNYYEAGNPVAFLVKVPSHINVSVYTMRSLENKQPGVGRCDGDWRKIMEDSALPYDLISEGRLSDYKESDYDIKYDLISGNY